MGAAVLLNVALLNYCHSGVTIYRSFNMQMFRVKFLMLNKNKKNLNYYNVMACLTPDLLLIFEVQFII